jgi:hypothetical protein
MLNLPEEDNFGLLKKEQGTKRGKIKFTNYDKKFGEKNHLTEGINSLNLQMMKNFLMMDSISHKVTEIICRNHKTMIEY